MPALFGVLTLFAGFVVGGILLAVGHPLFGVILLGGSIPVALVVWMKAGERF